MLKSGYGRIVNIASISGKDFGVAGFCGSGIRRFAWTGSGLDHVAGVSDGFRRVLQADQHEVVSSPAWTYLYWMPCLGLVLSLASSSIRQLVGVG